MTKQEFRVKLKKSLKYKFNILDIKCAKEILRLILEYKIPKSYKYHNNGKIFYKHNNKRFCNILLYNAMKCEVNMNYVINFLRKNKKYQIFVPKIQKIDFKIVKYRLPLLKNKLKINEPLGHKNYNNLNINIAIVPVLGACIKNLDSKKFDIADFAINLNKNSKNTNLINGKVFKRLGFGKGMYDRFYAGCKIKPKNVFVSRMLNVTNLPIFESHDIESNIYKSVYKSKFKV